VRRHVDIVAYYVADMNINLVCVGKVKESYFRQACDEYVKRLNRYCRVEVAEIAEISAGDKASPRQIENLLRQEYSSCQKHIRGTLIALDRQGEKFDSGGLAKFLENLTVQGRGEVTFLVGSSNGLCQEAKKDAFKVLSFSDMTFAHSLFRVMLLEQLYRAFSILGGSPYHK
jgi:23S rRNA (pseudouridine1915-N3)-methyltransferase